MSVFKTLKDLQAKVEASKPASDGVKRDYLTLKGGESARIRFLQEVAQDSPYYNEKIGQVEFATIHQGPGKDGFKRKMLCTAELESHDNSCFGCEKAATDWEAGWRRASQKALFNVAVLNAATGEWELRFLDQGFGKSHIVNQLLEAAAEFNGITNRTWKYTRTGSGLSDTSYNCLPLGEDVPDDFANGFELYDLSIVYPVVDYKNQAKFLGAESDELTNWTE